MLNFEQIGRRLPEIAAIFLSLFLGLFCVASNQESFGETEICEVELEEALVGRPTLSKRMRRIAAGSTAWLEVKTAKHTQPVRSEPVCTEMSAHNGLGRPLLI
ncbi:MAG: hypothetical protein ACE361_26740 [Aureliella sp.]